MHDISPKPERPAPGYSQEDWDEVSDTPSMTDAELGEMRPAQEVPEVYNLLPKRGRPKLADAKVNLTLRIDPALLAAYRATGSGWQVRMHDALAAGLDALSDADEAARMIRKAERTLKARRAGKVAPGMSALAASVLSGEGTPSGKKSGSRLLTMKRPKSA
ncbi:BrnA antitoxin family protein [Methylobacterium sp. E-025]|uniref:BrnA antitoxin family protein n=1 Tax=Methylobacterium sp. E-025 TaxID=2836561 RepID=UPI001FB98B05|nr:BrnA antitoxin family protein [Methylobacterium sp. E-025]MCJ2109969.1 BrnA antitoxin family protein [Methylobacterium sp. E-025]